MRAALSVWAWAAVGITVLVGFLVMVLLTPTLLVDRRRLVLGRTFRLMGVTAARLVPQWRFGIQGPVSVRPGPRTVCVSNHRSQSDPFLISRLPWEMKWLSKASMFRVPVLGWCMRLAGDIPVHRGVSSSGRQAMAVAARWIERGVPVMIFPEGTRSREAGMLPFKDGAFRLAVETGAELLPLAVHGSETALPKHDWKLGNAKGRVMVGRPIPTAGLTLEDVPRLKETARRQIELMVEAMRRGEAEVPALPPLPDPSRP